MSCLSRFATASRSISAADLRSPRLFALPRRLPDLGRLSTGQVGPSFQGSVGGLWTATGGEPQPIAREIMSIGAMGSSASGF